MCDWWIEIGKDVLIGLISGGLSSWIVTAIWQKKMDAAEKKRKAELEEHEYKTDYYRTVQILCRYLDKLQTELELKGSVEKAANIRRLIDAQPSTPIFTIALTKDGVKKMTCLYNLKRELDKDADGESISDEICEKYRRRLFQFECDFLKNQTSYLKPYADRGEEKTE